MTLDMHNMNNNRTLVLTFLVLAAFAAGAADIRTNAVKVLMIGNSFTASVMRETPNMAKAAGLRLDIVQCGIGGCPLERHWSNVEKSGEADFKPYFIDARLSSDTGRVFPKRANVTDMLSADKWDIVTIQQASAKSAFYDTYEPYA